MSNNPDQIRAEIEATRTDLSRNVDALAESVRPGNVARRQKDKATSAVFGAKDKATSAVVGAKDKATSAVFGAKDTVVSAVLGAKDAAADQAGNLQSTAGDVVHATGETIAAAPRVAQQRTQGNPLAAGLIALGVGWLVGSLLPATKVEQQAAESLKDKATPLAQEVSGAAQGALKEAAQNLQEPAQEAMEQVKSTASEAVDTVQAEGTSTASDVADTARDGAATVKESSQSS